MNTKILYLYRDAANYKVHNECVVKGTLTNAQKQSILDSLDAGEYFIPSLVGMPERKFDEYDDEMDHVWFELSEDGFEETDEVPTINISAEELAEAFCACKDRWEDAAVRLASKAAEHSYFGAWKGSDVLMGVDELIDNAKGREVARDNKNEREEEKTFD